MVNEPLNRLSVLTVAKRDRQGRGLRRRAPSGAHVLYAAG